MFEELAVNTNLYASLKRENVANGRGMWQEDRKSISNQPGIGIRRRSWRETTAAELKVWFGLIIKMGVHREPALPLHWNKRARASWRQISKKPLPVRVQQSHLRSRLRLSSYRIPQTVCHLLDSNKSKYIFMSQIQGWSLQPSSGTTS